jgi:hypothetical protein
MRRITLFAALLLGLTVAAYSQPRPIDRSAAPNEKKAAKSAVFEARYEGGLFGFSSKREGTIRFDDMNERMVFFSEDNRELFGIPYSSVIVVYPQSKSVTSTTGNVVRNVPLPGAALGGFIKEKRRYMILNVDDADADVKGVVNFKLKSKEDLDSLIDTLGSKAGLQQRGDSYYRPKKERQGP